MLLLYNDFHVIASVRNNHLILASFVCYGVGKLVLLRSYEFYAIVQQVLNCGIQLYNDRLNFARLGINCHLTMTVCRVNMIRYTLNSANNDCPGTGVFNRYIRISL